jgi:hypothetical protein
MHQVNSKNVTLQKVFFIFYDICIFLWYNEGSKHVCFSSCRPRDDTSNWDVTIWMTRWCSGSDIEVGGRAGGLHEVERNLRGLTMGVPSMRLRDVPYHLQRHTMGVPESLNHLLQRVARAVMCYHEHNVVQEDK